MLTINGRFLCKEHPTGTHRSSFHLMSQLCRLVESYQILCPTPPKMVLPEDIARRVKVTNGMSLPAHVWEQFCFPHQARHSLQLNLIGTGSFSRSTAPMAMVVHDVNYRLIPESFDWRFRAWYRFACGWAARAADIVFAVSEYTKETLVRHAAVDPGKVHVFRQGPGIRLDFLTNGTPGAKPTRPFVLCVGSLQPHKNLSGVLKAFDILRNHHSDCELVVVGQKQTYFNDAAISKKHLHDPDIRFTGYLSDAELGQLYQNATVFVYPSFEEGFGMPVVEAFYSGCPVVTSNVSCLPEIAGDAALLVNPRRPEQIASAMNQLLSNRSFREQLIERGRLRAHRYCWNNAAGQVLQKLERLQSTRRK